MRRILIVMGLLGIFGCKTKTLTSDKSKSDLRSIFAKEKLEEITVGELHLPTGKIIAGDPFFIFDQKPFKITVNPGNYPVKVMMHKVEKDHYRVAFAKIQFSVNQAVQWTQALTEDITDEQIKTLQKDEYFGYGVDAGLGCFTDVESMSIFNSAMDKFYTDYPDKNYYDDLLEEEFKIAYSQNPHSSKSGDWVNHFPKKGDSHNVIMFSSGWGDGYYPTYWGKDSSGNIVELLTDFHVVGGEK